MRPANERRHYNLTSSLIVWVHSQNYPCSVYQDNIDILISAVKVSSAPCPGLYHIYAKSIRGRVDMSWWTLQLGQWDNYIGNHPELGK